MKLQWVAVEKVIIVSYWQKLSVCVTNKTHRVTDISRCGAATLLIHSRQYQQYQYIVYHTGASFLYGSETFVLRDGSTSASYFLRINTDTVMIYHTVLCDCVYVCYQTLFILSYLTILVFNICIKVCNYP